MAAEADNRAADRAARIAALPPLREVLAAHGLIARRSLGQNFLLDLNVTRRIVREAGDLEGCTVVEIGPGPGGLTRALLAAPVRRVVAIERDPRCIAALAPLVTAAGGALTLIEADALSIDAAVMAEPPRAIVANLPYNIATPLLIGWLARIETFRSLTLMFQKEVADRIVARPGDPAYGRLSVICGWAARAERRLTLPARAFTPAPKVDSAVVRLVARDDRPPAVMAALETVTAAAFGQRRKMLRSSLRTLGDAEALCAAAGIAPTARAEEVGVEGFAALARAWQAGRADAGGATSDGSASLISIRKQQGEVP